MQRLSIPGDHYEALHLTTPAFGGTFRPRKSRLPVDEQTRILHLQKCDILGASCLQLKQQDKKLESISNNLRGSERLELKGHEADLK